MSYKGKKKYVTVTYLLCTTLRHSMMYYYHTKSSCIK